MCPDTGLPARDFTAPLRVVYHGRLETEQKRVQLFPQILAQLQASGLPFHWTIAGEGSERMALEQTMKSSPAQTVSFPGQIAYAKVPEILRGHDICLLASDYEGFCLSVAEAMGYGLVPVVSDLPAGIPEMVDKTTGILVPVNDVAGYARGIIHLHQHRDELAAKSAAARARVKTRFSVEAMAERWLRVLPQRGPNEIHWPESWRIMAPLGSAQPLRFSRPARFIRRCLVKLRR
jgi:glycosyltransferase involved in cell wall biosynthesis